MLKRPSWAAVVKLPSHDGFIKVTLRARARCVCNVFVALFGVSMGLIQH